MRVVALAGGVGGAKLAHGFSKILEADEFSVVVNTGDDFNPFGLAICPDIDTVCYTLAEISNPETGWGRRNEQFTVINTLKELGAPDWFLLGDKDIALHLERTRLLETGKSLTEVTDHICRKLGIKNSILPMTDDPVRTMVDTIEYGQIPFQEYFVKHSYQPRTNGFRFEGIKNAQATKDVIHNLEYADLIVLCPSNPFVSIDPIITLSGVRNILRQKHVIGVSPIIAGNAVKGPLALMFNDAGLPVHPDSEIAMYDDFVNQFIIDKQDTPRQFEAIPSSIIISKENILLPDIESRINLAKIIIRLYEKQQ